MSPEMFGIQTRKKGGRGRGGKDYMMSYGMGKGETKGGILLSAQELKLPDRALAKLLVRKEIIGDPKDFDRRLLTPSSGQKKDGYSEAKRGIEVDYLQAGTNKKNAQKIRDWFDNLSSEEQAKHYRVAAKNLKKFGYNLDYQYNNVLPNNVGITQMPLTEQPKFKGQVNHGAPAKVKKKEPWE